MIVCNNCHWGQGDFWSEETNPIRDLLELEDALLESDLSASSTTDVHMQEDFETVREMIIKRVEGAAKKIKNMRWRTMEDYVLDNPESKCPTCYEKLTVVE